MPREKELYRDNLDRLDNKFPDREMISYKELEGYLGISHSTAYRRFNKYYGRGGFTKTAIARELCN